MANCAHGGNLSATPGLGRGQYKEQVARMSGSTQDNPIPLTGRDIELTDTDLAVADHRDHMGRPIASSTGEVFRQDWPWIIGLIALVIFVVMAMGGNFR